MRITWRSSVVLAAALAASACSDAPSATRPPTTAAEVPVRPFDSLFIPVSDVRLRPDSLNPIGFAVSMAVGGNRVFIADPAQHDVKVFDRSTGALIRTLGRQGNGPGEFQTPATLTIANGDRLVIFDIGRNILSVWDTVGRLGYENLNNEFLISFVPVPGTSRVLTGGYATLKNGEQFDSAGKRPQVHEIDFLTGETKESYIMQPMSIGEHAWAGTYSTPRATLVNDVAVAGAMAHNKLWLHSRATGREWEMTLLAPWYHAPTYPKEYAQGGDKAQPGEMEAMEEWARQQFMLGYLIPLGNGRFLAQFFTRDKDKGRHYNYIVADTAGNSWISTQTTSVRLMGVQDALAFGINPDADDGETSLLTFRISPQVLGH